MIISLFNQKGGVGKTTTSINLAYGLKDSGKKVLLLDLDPQANSTRTLLNDNVEYSIYNFLLKEDDRDYKKFDQIIKKNDFDILPANLFLADLEQELISRFNRELVLNKKLDTIKNNYDYIIIDCPPNLGLLSINALSASDYLLIPLCLDYYSILGIDSINKYYKLIKENVNPKLEILGYLINKFDARKNEHKEKFELLKSNIDDNLLNSVIRTNSKLSLAQENSESIYSYDKKSRGAEDYKKLTEEILKKINK